MTSFDDDNIISGRSRRRCVKGRVSYLETDNLGPALSEEIDLNEERANDLEIAADPACNETLETEEYDGEPVTIDLSEFLAETALLAEALTDNATDSAAALSDCHSQFRVTSSKTAPPLCPVSDLSSLKELNLNEKTLPPEDSNCPVNPSPSVSGDLSSSTSKSAASDLGDENKPLEKDTLGPPSEVSNIITPICQSNESKTQEVSAAKDALKNTAAEALGKFPIVRCEKLNMENFVKKNTIKVGNWPLPKANSTPKSKQNASKNSSLKKPRSMSSKTPKLFCKPISFNKLMPKNSIGLSSNTVRSILVNPFEVKPPGLTYSISNSGVHRFVSSHTPVRNCLNEYSVGGENIIKVVSKNALSEHSSFTQLNKYPIITSVNKIGGTSKTLKIISPKKVTPAVAEHKNVGVTPILPKPVIEAITSPVLLNDASYTVIEPYVDDPTSPVRPKPILTVPVEVIPTIEGVESNELTCNVDEFTPASKVSSKNPKSSRSVFLNGAIKQTSVLSRHKKEPIPRSKSILTENNLVKADTLVQNFSDSESEESMPINKAKTAVVDAMTSVFSKNSKKQIKSKQNNSQNQSGYVADSSMFGCTSYNNSLNDILFGFSCIDDMVDVNHYEDEAVESPSPKKVHNQHKTLESPRKIVMKNKIPFKVISSHSEHLFADTCADSDTLSASECGDDSDITASKTPVTKKQIRHSRALKKKIKRGKRSDYSLESNENDEQGYKTPDLSSKKSLNENSLPQLSDNEPELPESKKESTDIKKQVDIEKSSEHSKNKKDNNATRRNSKNARLFSRGKRKPSNENTNNVVKQEPVEEPSVVSSKKTFKTSKSSLQFIHSRLKRNAKAQQSIKVVKKVRKQLSKPSAIIQEIKTITSGNSMGQKGKKLLKENMNTSEKDVIYPLSNVKHHKRKVKSTRPKSKKKIKTLKVLFKRSKQKQSSDNESVSSTSKDENSKSDSLCNENISQLPSKKGSESPIESAISDKPSGEIDSDTFKEAEDLVSTETDHSNLRSQNPEIKVIQDSEESSEIDGTGSKESTYPNDEDNSTLRDGLCSERSDDPTELTSGVTDESFSENINSKSEAENDNSGTNDLSIHKIDETKESSISSISREEICSKIVEDPKLLLSNDSSNLKLTDSEIISQSERETVSPKSGEADLILNVERTDTNSGSSSPLSGYIEPAPTEESVDKLDPSVSDKLEPVLEMKSSDKIDHDECHKPSSTEPDENTNLKSSFVASSIIESDTDSFKETCTSSSLVEPNGICAISEDSKTGNLSEHKDKEQDLVKTKVVRKRKKKRKPCPKLKISKTKTEPDSGKMKNLYVSERKASSDSADSDEASSRSNEAEIFKASCEKPSVLESEKTSESPILESSNSEVPKPITAMPLDNSPKSDPVNDITCSEALTNLNLNTVPTLDESLQENNSLISVSSTLEKKSDSHTSSNDDDSNLLEHEKANPDPNSTNFPKNSSEQETATDQSHMLGELISPKTIKEEPLDLDESTDQHDEKSNVEVKIEDEESDSIPVSTVRKRGRPKKRVAKAKKSQPVSGRGTAVILKKGRKVKSKITSYFKPQTSETGEPTMESVPVPVEVTSVPEVVTPKGATLPVEASIAAIPETTPTESTLLSAASPKVVSSDGASLNGVPTNETSTEEASLNADPSKATAALDDTCMEESPPHVNSVPERPKEAVCTDDTASSKALGPCDSKEEIPLKTGSENPLEGTSVDVSPAKAPATPAKPPVAQSISKSGSASNTPSNRGRKRKFCPEAVQIPFQMGWMREMVHRANEGNKVGQKVSDIYYFSPEGIKLRSMVEIGNYLSKHSESTLTLDNFTFARECVYHEPLEIERSAKQKSVLSTLPKFYKTKILDRSREMDAAMQKSPMKKFAPPLPSIPKLTIKNVNHGQVKKFTCVLGESSSNSTKSDDAKLNKKSQSCLVDNNAPSPKKFKASPEKQSISMKDTSKDKSNSQSLTSKNSERTSAAQSNIERPDLAQIQRTFKKNLSGSKKANTSVIQSRAKLKSPLPKLEKFLHRPCTYHCEVARYQVPNVKCALCFCLFHKHCVPKIAESVGYACKSCVSKKLALYESVRNPAAPSPFTDEEEQDIPLDVEVSILFPEIELKESSNSELRVHDSPANRIQSGYAASPNPLRTPDATNPKPVPYMPCLVKHLLRPPSPMHPGSMQNGSRPYAPLLPSQQGNSVLPNCIPPNVSATNCRPIIVHCSRNGRTFIRNGLVVTAPANANPLTALQSLTQDIIPSEKWAGVSSPLSSNLSAQSSSSKNNIELPPIVQKSSLQNDSILAATLSGKIPSGFSYTHVNQSSYGVNRLLTGHDCLKQVFKLLDVCDLLRVGQVCKSWNYLSTQSFLWEKMKFSNLMVTNWRDCCLFLKKAGTKCLDFQDIIHPSNQVPFESLEDYISILNNVEEVIFDQIPSSILVSVALNLHQLRKLECHFVTDAVTEDEMWNTCTFKLSSLQGLNRLTKLKLNSCGGIILKCDPEYLMPFLPNLRYLTLTGFKFGSHINLECLSMHKELISLELGDCSDIEPELYALLGSLKKLRCLRLENGGSLEDIGFVNCLEKMTSLEVLELMNFKIPKDLEKAFQHFQQLIHLNIWPDTTSEGSMVNNNLLQALTHCKDLSYACWGVITEGEDAPSKLEIKNHENETEELSYEELFHKLVKMLPECRVEVKFVPRKSWREFCSVRN